ncbi:MAG: hypothetical protein ACRDBO_00830 [Lachnospiraceae bacterium]
MKTVLFSVSYLIEVEEGLLTGSDESEVFNDNVFKKLSKNSWKKIDAKHKAEWNCSCFSVLDPTQMNCGKCCRCDNWVTDREKPASIAGLTNGATVNGELLCDECLPEGHRWAF